MQRIEFVTKRNYNKIREKPIKSAQKQAKREEKYK